MTAQPTRPQVEESALSVGSVHSTLDAARLGRRAYPGPTGELIERLLTSLLPGAHSPGAHSPGAHSEPEPERTLPVRYRPGTPLHWEPVPERSRTASPRSGGEG